MMRWPRLPSATAPRQWPPGDLKAVTERAIAKMKEEGLLVEEQMPSTGRFRRGRGHCGSIGPARLAADQHASGDADVPRKGRSERAALPSNEQLQARERARTRVVVNWSIPGQLIDQLPMAVVVVNCPPLRGH